MKKRKRLLALLMSVALLLPTMSAPVSAADPAPDMIHIASDWQGSVFGDVGGQDKITAGNFGIHEHGDGTVTLKSAGDRGKISGSSEGIAYYFKEVPANTDFEITATASVDSLVANNQTSFGIMLRSKVATNISFKPNDSANDPIYSPYYFGNYVAAGALDQMMKGFHRGAGSIVKQDFSANVPASGEVYDLSIKKMGNNFVLKIGEQTQTITDYSGDIAYAGVYTARNATVTYSDVKLKIDGQIELGDWDFSAFGSNTSAGKNPDPTLHSDGSVTLSAAGGKIAQGDEGLSYYYNHVPVEANFEIVTKATVVSFNSDSSIGTPNQKSFGLMLRDEIGPNGSTSKHTSNFVAAGALDTVTKAVYQQSGSLVKLSPFHGVNAPTAGEVYDLSIKKSGNVYVVSANGQSEIITADHLFSDSIYAGFYVARDAEVIFSDFGITVETKAVTALNVDAANMKTEYLVGESLDPTGLHVTATYSDNMTETIPADEFIITGFNSSTSGVNTITIHYGGRTATVELTIIPLDVTNLSIKYYPAKTDYYLGDTFDPEGFVVEASYNDGYMTKELTSDQYTFSLSGDVVDSAYVFHTPGTKTITVASNETPTATTSFDVEVKSATITALDVRQRPAKTQYFIGEILDLSGLVIYAKYGDAEVRLMKSEYSVSALDASTPGSKVITITHKGTTTSFSVEVKEKELVGIAVTKYPKTLYTVGDDFSNAGLEVSKVYDNEDQEVLLASDYTVDTSQFNKTKPGLYDIHIIPADTNIEAIILKVTVREASEVIWNSIRFGQSTSDQNNKVTDIGEGAVRLEALGGSAGKVTGDHDGISFYYTEIDAAEDNFVLSADIKVIEYAKNPQDGQESFGIMARDAIGAAGDSSVFASNIAAIGGYSGSTTGANGTQLFARTGVTSPDGAGSQGIKAIMMNNERPSASNTPYKLTLAKTNSGYTGKINDGTEEIIYTPAILNVQDSKIYVGFYAARLATIEVSNIQFTVSAAETDAPRVEPPKQAIQPGFEFLSLDKTADTAYELMIKANVDGTVTIKEGSSMRAQDQPITAGQIFALPVTLPANGNTSFSVALLPDDTQYLTSYDKIVRNFTVATKSYSGDMYVSPAGTSSGSGTESSPLDLDTAIAFVKAGQHIIMLDGRYVRNAKLEIKKYNDGKPGAMKSLIAAPGATPIIDFDKKTEGVVLGGSYWHVKGIDITRSAGNTKGFTIGGSYNIIEKSNFYDNGDTGLQISRTDGADDELSKWPSHNLILNSTSYDNRDPSDNNADGFAAKLTSGVGNIFRGCIAHNNIDDGWDLYTKAGSGAIGAVIIEDSIAYNNGFLTNGTVGAGDKNGFKLGGEGIHVPHVIRNSIAFGNGAYGFTSNSNPGVIAQNNVGFNNARGNISFTTYGNIATDFTIDGFVSYQQEVKARDSYPAHLSSDQNYMFDGTASVNKSGVKLTDDNFKSLMPQIPYERDAAGDIIWGDFLKFIAPEQGSGQNPDRGNPGTSYPWTGGSNAPEVKGTQIQVTPSLKGETAHGMLNDADLKQAFANAAADARGVKQVQVKLVQSASAARYELTIPVPYVTEGNRLQQILVSTELADVLLPGNMLSNAGLGDAQNVAISVAIADLTDMPADIRDSIGSGPMIELNVTADGKDVTYNNPDAPVVLSIPYEPTAEELEDPEHITVWFVDGSGKVHAVPTGKYNADTGKVTFITSHFSQYAIAYVQKSFEDIAKVAWAKKEIEVLASKGVINGTTAASFSPSDNVKRADFVILIVKALGLSATFESNFTDVHSSAYYYDEVGIAKQLGIVNGKGDGRFDPTESISRQDMIVIAARALEAAGEEAARKAAAANLAGFTDHASVSAYATQAIAAMVEAGVIQGDDQKRLKPLAHSTRAEAAVMIYKLYNLHRL